MVISPRMGAPLPKVARNCKIRFANALAMVCRPGTYPISIKLASKAPTNSIGAVKPKTTVSSSERRKLIKIVTTIGSVD
ncbi:hypothetical protein DSM106972_058200 [Dulcicalothrix desertica PCC 7102]|uniref:Uncharacterized protein n=1 Tax=Dulcicalothrix desertica PCC 7102 TaxID=232991 RepID=A0A3S1IV56_9CYAN|nr:hypothetical protein DSM106972_058200 [Dulcicalothrix desertica PCC 7102]